jgi:hypothetical protein
MRITSGGKITTGGATTGFGNITVYEGTNDYANISIQTQTSTRWFVGAGISGVNGNSFAISTNSNNTSPALAISSGGILSLGTTADFGQEAAPMLAINVKNSIARWGINMQADAAGAFRAITFYNSAGTSQGFISVSGSGVTTYSVTASDIRLKQNIEVWDENVLNSFSNIQPKTFEFIGYENPETQKGFIAQDMVDSFPEAYPIDEKGFYAFNPSGMVVYLMKAIKELKAEIEELKAK